MVKISLSLVTIVIFATAFCVQTLAHTVDFNHYWTFEEIQNYLSELQASYPTLGHSENFGTTAEGRSLSCFCVHKHHHARLPVIFIEAGVRPREWIGVMAALYFLHEIVEHHYDYDALLDNFEFVVIPVSNPDGYVYTHGIDRLWNKNRRSVGSGCFGVDVNGNFRYQFRRSDDVCSPNYPGDFYFSERETYQLSNYMSSAKFNDRTIGYISLQAFGQQILVPYNYFNIGSSNNAALISIANRAANAIRLVNPQRTYQVGVGGALRNPQFGTSTDYAKGSRNIENVITFMLPRGGNSGYEVPVNEMSEILREVFAGIVELNKAIAGL